MHIEYVEIRNLRKLKSVRIEFGPESTLFVGANNSGKSTAMFALRSFLRRSSSGGFCAHDLTLSHWTSLNTFGQGWLSAVSGAIPEPPDESQLRELLPSLDVWIQVNNNELYRARDLLPTLDWEGGLLGVRLLYQPKDTDALMREFVKTTTVSRAAEAGASKTKKQPTATTNTLWPKDFQDFLSRRMGIYFSVKTYLLDPKKQQQPVGGVANPQPLPEGSEPLEGNPLENLVRVDEIGAQRGLGEASSGSGRQDDEAQGNPSRQAVRRLSSQLTAYYRRHLDPAEHPEPEDLEALRAIAEAERLFDERLEASFAKPIEELQQLNYPGVADPRLKIATRVRPTDGLNHPTAVQYEAAPLGSDGEATALTLPEDYNGLGFQNLISIVFRLMGFRDAWMRVGKEAKAIDAAADGSPASPPPLHLVLVEEPEAHLHAQVQQVFVRQAYKVLRNHDSLRAADALATQLVVSTHSSHVAHETDFSDLRYFRRLPATGGCPIPSSSVSNKLPEVFGTKDETREFVARYLQATHCDLFFADAAILVEGTAERMLVPHFIKHYFPDLHRCYVTVLEIGGSHAHRLRPLIEHLGLTTLVVTDLDPQSGGSPHKSEVPARGTGQRTGNPTLREWLPMKTSVDELIDLSAEEKVQVKGGEHPYSVRVAFQTPVNVQLRGTGDAFEMLASTFEDALVLENASAFRDMDGTGMLKKFVAALNDASTPDELRKKTYEAVRSGNKGTFALDVLFLKDPQTLRVPTYLDEGLRWLEQQIVPRRRAADARPTSG